MSADVKKWKLLNATEMISHVLFLKPSWNYSETMQSTLNSQTL